MRYDVNIPTHMRRHTHTQKQKHGHRRVNFAVVAGNWHPSSPSIWVLGLHDLYLHSKIQAQERRELGLITCEKRFPGTTKKTCRAAYEKVVPHCRVSTESVEKCAREFHRSDIWVRFSKSTSLAYITISSRYVLWSLSIKCTVLAPSGHSTECRDNCRVSSQRQSNQNVEVPPVDKTSEKH